MRYKDIKKIFSSEKFIFKKIITKNEQHAFIKKKLNKYWFANCGTFCI